MSVHPIRTGRLSLVSLSPDAIVALLSGRSEDAQSLIGASIPGGWPDEHDARFLRLRLDQMRVDPASQEWLARTIVLRDRKEMAGHAGFHGPPAGGCAEIGYTVFEPHRRRGYAEEAVRGLMDWAGNRHGVRRFRLSISPDNDASLALAAKLGFERTGEQQDPEDGLEYVFELSLGPALAQS